MSMEAKIKGIVCDVIATITTIGKDIYELSEDSNLLDAGLDSFQIMNIIVELENRLNIVFRDEDLIIIHFQSIKEICVSLTGVLKNYDERV